VVDAKIDGTRLTLTWGEIGKSEITIKVTNTSTQQILHNRFIAEVWQPNYWTLALTVIGGLGIFLLGMKNMSEGMQAVAGDGLRRMISAVTDNRFMATGVGLLVTMLLQSSTITTVMTVGFVNSGFMTLSQAIGVIMGANIGTTITGWILALKVDAYGLPLTGAGAFVYLFSNRDRWRYSGMALMGLGMVFLGLELMKDGFAVVKDLPTFERWFEQFTADTYFGVLKCALVGCVLTFIVQSSSATLGITIGLAQIGVIPFETAAALVLGENIGTTITAWLASFGTTTNAKRAAYFHVLFNVLGVMWITAIFIPFYLPLIRSIVGTTPDPETGQLVVQNVTGAIATTHTLFNVTNTLVFLPFTSFFASMLQRFVPDRPVKEKRHLTKLDVRMLETPVIAIEQTRKELLLMGEGCNQMIDMLKTILAADTPPDDDLVKQVLQQEESMDTMQDEVIAFLTDMLSSNVPHNFVDEVRGQLRMADEYESVSDYVAAILKSHLKLHRENLRMPEPTRTQLEELCGEVAAYLRFISKAYLDKLPPAEVTKSNWRGDAVVRLVKDLRKQFLAKMTEERIEPMVSVAFNTQLNAYRRVRDHALNIAEALAGEK
jgi:phosphate:Na+ symporter